MRRGQDACLVVELKKKFGIKTSCSILDRIVCMGREAKRNQVCLARKKHDATSKSRLAAEVGCPGVGGEVQRLRV